MLEYQAVPKRTIKRLEYAQENDELKRMIFILELCRESNDDLWKQLVLLHLQDLKILKGREGNILRNEIRRKLQYEL